MAEEAHPLEHDTRVMRNTEDAHEGAVTQDWKMEWVFQEGSSIQVESSCDAGYFNLVFN